MNESDAARPARIPAWAMVVPIGVLVALAAAFWVGRVTAPDGGGGGPAVDVARRIGVAIPVAQEPAFADGEITFDEVTAAHDRFVDCVEQDGPVTGFRSTIDDRASVTFSFDPVATPGVHQLVAACQIEHLDATRQTFVAMTKGATG